VGPTLTPPVANKLIFAGFLKVMVVGGPNSRMDYHLQVGWSTYSGAIVCSQPCRMFEIQCYA